jgi:hypothetical protein
MVTNTVETKECGPHKKLNAKKLRMDNIVPFLSSVIPFFRHSFVPSFLYDFLPSRIHSPPIPSFLLSLSISLHLSLSLPLSLSFSISTYLHIR